MNNIDDLRAMTYEAYFKHATMYESEYDQYEYYDHEFLNLLRYERGNKVISEERDKLLLSEAKERITTATKAALKRNLSDDDKTTIASLFKRINEAQDSDDLHGICFDGFEVLLKYKPNS